MTNTLYQHSAGHYAIDHANYQDVIGTYYKKGVITDFEVDETNPITITKSHVKVNVDGLGETSEYLPLFYKNKPMYWDSYDGNYSAGVWNEEGGYYEQAWQCFRCGDEVVVQCEKEDGTLTPKRVVGFVDGIPRLGENVFKVQSTPQEVCRGNPQYSYFLAYKTNIWTGAYDWEEYFQRADFAEDYWDDDCYNVSIEFPAPSDITFKTICNDTGDNFKHLVIPSAMSGYTKQWHAYDGFVILNSQMSPSGDLVCGTYEGTICESVGFYRRIEERWSYDIHYFFWAVGPVMYCWPAVAPYVTTVAEDWWKGYWFRNWEGVYYGDIPPYPEEPPCVTPYCDQHAASESYYHMWWTYPQHPSAWWDTWEEYTGGVSGEYQPVYCPSAIPYEYDLSEGWEVFSWHDNAYDTFSNITDTWFGLSAQGYEYDAEIYACLYKPEIWNNATTDTPKANMYAQSDFYATWTWYFETEASLESFRMIPPNHGSPTRTEE